MKATLGQQGQHKPQTRGKWLGRIATSWRMLTNHRSLASATGRWAPVWSTMAGSSSDGAKFSKTLFNAMESGKVSTWGMAGQSALSSTSSLRVGARLANPGGSSRGANCFEAIRNSFRRRSPRNSVTGAGITSPNFLGDRNVRLHQSFMCLRQQLVTSDSPILVAQWWLRLLWGNVQL